MMESNSFTSEPQYQRPDDRNSMVHFIPRPIIQQQAPPVVVAPQPVAVDPGVIHYLDPNFARPLYTKFGKEPWIFNRLDFFGNSIIFGAICNGLAFIIYGFFRCKVFRRKNSFMWAVILCFGGLGQTTAGFLEYCKGRTFPCTVYLCFGFYCFTHYAYYFLMNHFEINYNTTMYYNFDGHSLAVFYAGWTFITFGMILSAVRSNLIYMLQLFLMFASFLLRAIGEGTNSMYTKRHASGIFEVLSGFFSLYMAISQIINNETCYIMTLPTCPMSPDNEIDILPAYLLYPSGGAAVTREGILDPEISNIPIGPLY